MYSIMNHIKQVGFIMTLCFCGLALISCSQNDSLNDLYYNQYMTDADYNECLRIPSFPCSYYEITRNYGEPISSKTVDSARNYTMTEMDYKGISFFLLSKPTDDIYSKSRLVKVIITDPEFSFGDMGIKIGSYAKDVASAYYNNPKAYEVDGEGSGYIDATGLYIRFKYNSKDQVDQITITLE